MKSRVIARRYAEAFFQVILKRDLDTSYAEFTSFMQTVKESDELRSILAHPSINLDRKGQLLRQALKSFTEPSVVNFLQLLLQRHRFDLLGIIADELKHLYRQEKKIVAVRVRTAVPLRDDERKELVASLGRDVSGSVELREKVDPAIVGGMIVAYQDKVMDASVRNRMKLMRERLLQMNTELMATLKAIPSRLA